MSFHHLPGSAGAPIQPDLSWLDGELVVTEKLDGGELTFTRDGVHGPGGAPAEPWDRPATALWTMIAHHIPDEWRVCGESMWARRGIAYTDLPGVFVVFGIWDETDTLLGWDDTVDWAERLELPVVPVLYRGVGLSAARAAWSRSRDPRNSEGFVVRSAGRIAAADLPHRLLCWVRPAFTTVPAGSAVNEFA
ncbi:RNA ligase family protein [Actinoplanes sp. NPDC049265]|uniref:RNA ligase family protein n=1 Tax=Actinoplanes sp. NPDC049265 TaxID=3363902 RepID=UPI00371906DA